MFLMTLAAAWSCSMPTHAADSEDLPKPTTDLPAPSADETSRTAVFAGGCFWCTEAAFEQLDGVTDVVSGYAGGTKKDAHYETVGVGGTGHAESIKITYDPRKITYGELLRVLFTISEPTIKDKQGPDAGHQYRMAVFYANDDEKRVAEAYIRQLTDAKAFGGQKIQTTVEPLGDGFFPAEDYHQDYVAHHPDQPYVRAWSIPKVNKLREHFPTELKGATTRASK
jgi:peptide-methionine (S)-S-oxide reductase